MKNIKTLLLITFGIIVGGLIGVGAANFISSDQVIYKNNKTVSIALDGLFDELNVGKELLAESITNKGVETTSDNTLEEMAYNVDNIVSDTGALRMITKDEVTTDELKNAVMVGALININGTTSDTFIVCPVSGASVGSGDINGTYFGISIIWDKESGTLIANPANSLTIKKYFLFVN